MRHLDHLSDQALKCVCLLAAVGAYRDRFADDALEICRAEVRGDRRAIDAEVVDQPSDVLQAREGKRNQRSRIFSLSVVVRQLLPRSTR